jgi:CubicO group peptidase (beta-lactamase class C family)
MRILFSVLLSLVLLPPVVRKGSDAHLQLAERMAFYKVPAVSIAVVHEGRLVRAEAWGLVRAGARERVTPETLFQAASLSKPVTAAGFLRSDIDLDAPANTLLRSWKIPNGDAITPAHLLSHSAAMTVGGFPGYEPGKELPTTPQILDGIAPANTRAIRVDGKIGVEVSYSGGGYVVLQQLLEDVTQQPFEVWMHDHLLAPLGMTHSTFGNPPLQQTACGHESGVPLPLCFNLYPEKAAAGLWTTPSDLARFIVDLRARHDRQLQPFVDDMGLGIYLSSEGEPRFVHEGLNRGFQSMLFGFIDRGEGAVIMTNSDHADELLREILRGLAAEYGWSVPKPKESIALPDLTSYPGTYLWPNGRKTVITLVDGKLFTSTDDDKPLQLHAKAQDVFFIAEGVPTYTFLRRTDGKVTAMEFERDHGETRRYLRKEK